MFRFESAFKLIKTSNNYSRGNRLLKRGEGYRTQAHAWRIYQIVSCMRISEETVCVRIF